MDCSLPGSSIHGIFQARVLEWFAISFIYAEYIMRNARLNEAQAGIKITGRSINNLRYADDTILMTEIKEEFFINQRPLDESERGEWKSWLKAQHSQNKDHGIWSHHFMANRWGNSERLYFLGFQNTVNSDCSHEIKRRLLLGRKVMTNLDSIFKSRDITLLIKVCLVKAMVFPVVMYRCESWTIKKAECWRIDAFELWCWKTLEISLEISPGDQPVNPKGNQP